MTTSETLGVGIVVAAHAELALGLVNAAGAIVGNREALHPVSVDAMSDIDAVQRAVRDSDESCGVLVLADLFGGSAANLALTQLDGEHVEVVTGVNLAMVIEALTHRTLPLRELAERVARAGAASIVVPSQLLGHARPAA